MIKRVISVNLDSANTCLNMRYIHFHELAKDLALGTMQYEELRVSNTALVARVLCEDGHSVVIKLWKRPGIRSIYRRLTQTGNVDREWKVLSHLHRLGLSVPKPLYHFRFGRVQNEYTDVIFIQDLGSCPRGMDFLPKLIEQRREGERLYFEDSVIELTKCIIDAGVLDCDHHMVNILALPTGDAARIDFEIASIIHIPKLFRTWLARMISRLMATYIFAVQPHLEYADQFAIRLREHLNPSPAVLKRAQFFIEQLLERQRKDIGVDTQWTLPW